MVRCIQPERSGSIMTLYDNGLTPEQQAEVDKVYQELMEEVKKNHPVEYEIMMKELEIINNVTHLPRPEVKQDNQLELLLEA